MWREVAAEMLGYNDDPATRDLLLKTLARGDDWELVLSARGSARRLWGPDALEPDYAFLQNELAAEEVDDDVQDALKRVSEKGEARRIFEILPRCHGEVQQRLAATLLNRPNLPVPEAEAALGSESAPTVRLVAQIL